MIHNIPYLASDGSEHTLGEYQGKLVLIVNTATKCGFAPQFDGLEDIWQTLGDDVQVLGFPCDQFAGQEPTSDSEMSSVCRINHGVTFPLMAKIKVNGSNTHPLYQYLKSQQGGWFGSAIKWNFTKFLIDRNGKVIKRYSPLTSPTTIKKDIQKLLKK